MNRLPAIHDEIFAELAVPVSILAEAIMKMSHNCVPNVFAEE